MSPDTLGPLLKLPARERAEIAIALWESLSYPQRESAFAPLTPEQAAELDRRMAEHVAAPGTAIPWTEVRRKLRGGA